MLEKQGRYLRGECFRCGDKYGLGHHCKMGTFKILKAVVKEDNQVVILGDNQSGFNRTYSSRLEDKSFPWAGSIDMNPSNLGSANPNHTCPTLLQFRNTQFD
ncbi:hypothetical protein Hanom_Chr07g00633061 [Helianthus anomalus]